MNLNIPPQDVPLLNAFRCEGVLLDLDDKKFPAELKRGVQVCCCADSDQFDDMYGHLRSKSQHSRHAPISLYGGVMLIAEKSPLQGQTQTILDNLLLGYQLDKGRAIVLAAHWPCGAAYLNNIHLDQYARMLGEAKQTVTDFLQRNDADPEVMIHLHVDYSKKDPFDKRKRTYYVDRHAIGNVLMKALGGRQQRAAAG